MPTNDPGQHAAVRRVGRWPHLDRFVLDVARWLRPEAVGDPREVTVARTVRLLYRHPPLRAVAWFRVASWSKDLGIPGVGGALQRRLLRLYGLELSSGADIGGGLYIAHPSGCVISVERMGRNATIIANVTVGTRGDGRWPRLGDDVFIGSGARILGGIVVGDGAVVGANAVVIHDVPPGVTVGGIPARPLHPRS